MTNTNGERKYKHPILFLRSNNNKIPPHQTFMLSNSYFVHKTAICLFYTFFILITNKILSIFSSYTHIFHIKHSRVIMNDELFIRWGIQWQPIIISWFFYSIPDFKYVGQVVGSEEESHVQLDLHGEEQDDGPAGSRSHSQNGNGNLHAGEQKIITNYS